MAIIVEGFDNSGKSTLAASFHLTVVHPGPRPKNEEEERLCLEHQLMTCGNLIVMDRVTSLSTPAYSGNASVRYGSYLRRMLDTPYCVLVYCRPPIEVIKDFSRHICKSYDEASKVQWLHDHAEEIVERYDFMMSQVPHRVYDYTNPDLELHGAALSSLIHREEWKKWDTRNIND